MLRAASLASLASLAVLVILGCGSSPPPPVASAAPGSMPPPADGAPAAEPPADGVPAAEPPADGAVACTKDAKVCPDGTEVGRGGPRCEFAPCPEAKSCATDADCQDGQACVGSLGCDETWRCARVPCTRDLVTYCGCDGKTFQGSGTCPSRKAARRGPC
jgi:hypothetical protein